MSEILKRTLSGAAYVLTVVLAVYFGSVFDLPYIYGVLFLLLMVGTMYEFYHLVTVHTSNRPNWVLGLVSGILLFVGVFIAVYAPGMMSFKAWMVGGKLCAASLALLLLVAPAIQIFSSHATPIQNWGTACLGWLYIAVPFSMASLLPRLGDIKTTWQMLLFPIIMVWVNDTGAYLVGRWLGKHKLIERVSPGKTVEGFIGGVLFTVLVSLVMSYFASWGSGLVWIGLGVVVSLFAVVGDLVESQLKRSLLVKDSGKFLPGHGGFLDRFDSLLFALVGAASYYMLV